jgi:glycosyltransferase involved in cell wall biosynthesis
MIGDDRPGLTSALQAQQPGEVSGTVLMVTPRWVRDGGVGAHVQASAAALARHGWHVLALAKQVEPGREIPGVNVLESPELFNRSASMTVRLGEVMSGRPKVIHLHQIGDPTVVDFMRARAPVVISTHGYPGCTSGVYYFHPGEECTRSHGPGCVPNLLMRGCAHTTYPRTLPAKYRTATRVLTALRRADLVVSYSSAVDRHLAVNGLIRRTVVPYFPTIAPKPGSGDAQRPRVLFAGRIVAEKGVDVLIRAACDVDAQFVICGDGRGLGTVRALARSLGVEERMSFMGWLDPERLADEFASASVVVVPSLWPEPLGGVGIEAMASGRPVVASATGGILDWLVDGVTGLCVAPGDERALAQALNELLADPERRLAMGAAGRDAVAARFSPERHVAALAASYRAARTTWQSGRTELSADGEGDSRGVLAHEM